MYIVPSFICITCSKRLMLFSLTCSVSIVCVYIRFMLTIQLYCEVAIAVAVLIHLRSVVLFTARKALFHKTCWTHSRPERLNYSFYQKHITHMFGSPLVWPYYIRARNQRQISCLNQHLKTFLKTLPSYFSSLVSYTVL